MASPKRKTTPPPNSSSDPVTAWAQSVASGAIVAGPHVRNAAKRHLDDLERGSERGLVWDLAAMSRALRFFPGVLKLAGGKFEGRPFELHPSQAFKIGSLFGWKRADTAKRRFRRAYIEEGKGNGKALAIDTPIATPRGFVPMGDLRPGDQVFDETGSPCNVTAVSGVMLERPCYRMRFSDGAEIVADADHLWLTSALRTGLAKGPKSADAPRKGKPAIRTTAEIAATVRVKASASAHPQAKWNHRVDIAGALDMPAADLSVPPYVLGVWLGDGDTDSARLTVAYSDWEIVENVVADGVTAHEQRKHSETTARVALGADPARIQARRCDTLQAKLRAAGLIGDKHVPEPYFWASREQRLALLQGLMDTDGAISASGQAEFSVCRERLALDAARLARTLGFKVSVTEGAAKLNGREVGRRWRVCFWPDDAFPVFKLTRKAARQKAPPNSRAISRGRMIVACDPVESVPVQCISVDSPSRLFLAGEHLVPTHNSPLAAGIGMYCLLADGEARAEVYAAASKKDQAMVLFRDAVAMRNQSPHLAERLTPSGGNPVWNLADLSSGSFFRPISSDDGQSGPRPSCALCDEVHEHRDGTVIEMLERGFKAREQPLLIMITNSGSDLNSVCWEEHVNAIRAAAGNPALDGRIDETTDYLGDPDAAITYDDTFSFVCALDGQRKEAVSGLQAVEYMENVCTCNNVQITLTNALMAEVFATHVTCGGIKTRGQNDAQITLTDQSKHQDYALPATTRFTETKRRQSKRHGIENCSSNGLSEIDSGYENIKGNGFLPVLNIELTKLRSRLLEGTGSKTLTSTNFQRNKAEDVQYAQKNRDISALTTAIVRESLEGSSASRATLQLACSEIIQKVYEGHSNTCCVRKLELNQGTVLVHRPADDPLTDPSCWVKANPLLGVTQPVAELERAVRQAKAMPGKLNNILRLHFCQWTQSDKAWIARETLEAVLADFDPTEFECETVYLGADLSGSQDLTALAFMTQTGFVDLPADDGGKVRKPTFALWLEAWTPGDTISERAGRDKAPYDVWRDRGFLHAPPGRQIRLDYVAARIARAASEYRIAWLAYDRYAYARLADELDAAGVTVRQVEHAQGGKRRGKPPEEIMAAARYDETKPDGLWMPASLGMLETLILEKRIVIQRNPVLISAMMSAAIEEDAFGNRWLSKRKATNRIDCAVAACMAVGVATAEWDDLGGSIYTGDRGLTVFG